MVVGLDRNSATLMPYYIYIYSRHSPETRFSSTHAYVYDRPARIKPCFVLMCSRERDWYSKGDGNSTFPSPIFSNEQGQRRKGSFFVLTFASFQRNEPRGKWKSRTNGVEDNRPWKCPKRPLLSSCRRVSSVLFPLGGGGGGGGKKRLFPFLFTGGNSSLRRGHDFRD